MTELPVGSSGASAIDIAREAAAIAASRSRAVFGHVDTTRAKGNRDVVTEVDVAIEREVVALVSREFPGHAILGEESASSVRSEGWLWVLDPIDGTKNFSRGITHFGFSLALCYAGEPVLGIITHPLIGEEYLAVAGGGFTVNGEPVHLAELALANAVVSVDLGFKSNTGMSQLALAQALWPLAQGIRTMGSAALGLAFVAAGRFDAYIHPSLEPWDLAAGLLLVREAGGIVTTHDGSPATIFTPQVVAAAPGVHTELMSVLRNRPTNGADAGRG